MFKYFISMAATLLVSAQEQEAGTACSGALDPTTTPEQLLVELEIQKTRAALEFYEARVKELAEAVAAGPQEQ